MQHNINADLPAIRGERNVYDTYGIADGDITDDTTDDDLKDYTEDDTFADLMGTFLYLMRKASKSGLYCNGILSTE